MPTYDTKVVVTLAAGIRDEVIDHLKTEAFLRNVEMKVDETRHWLSSTFRCNLTAEGDSLVAFLKYIQSFARVNEWPVTQM